MSRAPPRRFIRVPPAPRVGGTGPQAPAAQEPDMSPANMALLQVMDDGAFAMILFPSDQAMDIHLRDEREGTAMRVLASALASTREQDEDFTAIVAQGKVTPLIHVAHAPLALDNLMGQLPVIRESGLETMSGARLPVQSMEGFAMLVTGDGPPEAEDSFDAFCNFLERLYRPNRLIRLYHRNTALGADEPAVALPMTDLPETVLMEAFPGLMEDARFGAWLDRFLQGSAAKGVKA